MFKNNLPKLAIGNESNGDVIILSNVAEGLDGAASFYYEPSYNDLSIEDNQTYNFSTEHELEIQGLPGTSSEQTKLENITDNHTDVYATALGLNGGLLWDKGEFSAIFSEQFSEGLAWQLRLSAEGLPWYDQSSGKFGAGIHVGENLLGLYEWKDRTGDGVADGWSLNGITSGDLTFNNSDEQSATGDANEYVYRDIFWPFQKTVTLSVDYKNVSDTHSIELISLDETKTTVGSASTTTFSSVGSNFARKSVSHTPPSGSFFLRVRVALFRASQSLSYKDPALRLNSKTSYVKI